jgi:threonine dehydrogenase-like Zn-dependent dehydrogenase
MANGTIPVTQHAIQLVGPGELTHNRSKEVLRPNRHQVLAKVEAVGLCFSDLKLLKQFSQHARKGEVLQGIERQVLGEIPSYVPGDKPTVPGHEVVCTIVAVGDQVRRHSVGERCLVQTDYRALLTAGSNAAFGYNFEGGLQEYVLMDERVIIDPASNERFLIPVDKDLSASAVALVEPWACVENSYVNPERKGLKPGGRLLVVIEDAHAEQGLQEVVERGKPACLTAICRNEHQREALRGLGVPIERAHDADGLPGESFDDIIYFGARKSAIATLNDKLAAGGIINIVTGGRRIGEPVSVGVGRVHYGMTRWIGNHGMRASDSYLVIPERCEIRNGEEVAVIGAAGPMGQMHVIRALCLNAPGISLVCTDVDDARLEALRIKAMPLSEKRKLPLRFLNTRKDPLGGSYSYFILLVPAAALVAEAIAHSSSGCLINIFAGIPAATRHELDLDTYISNRCYMFGSSGSVIRDMKIVLNRVRNGQLDTNISVDAICGMAGAAQAIAAVENRSLAGKIIVYPSLHDVGLIPLAELDRHFPLVGRKLDRGQWTRAAEDELLKITETSSPE